MTQAAAGHKKTHSGESENCMEFRILGPLEVEDEGRVLKLGGAKQRGL